MVIRENDDAIRDGIRTSPEDPVKELISMIHITCEGRNFDFFDGATPQNLWNMVRGTRGKEAAVLAEMDGELLDFQTPFPSGGDVRWIPLSAPKAHQAYVRSAIMLLVCAVEEIYGEGADVLVKHSLGKSLYCEFEDGHVPLKKELDRLAERIVHTAAQILCKDYQSLTDHAVKNKHFFGVRTLSDINYSALSMGAGEQRLIKILTVVYHAPPYSLILIDEIDLLLHSNAQKQLIKQLSDLAQRKNLQIIFTTHSLEIGKLTEFVDIRYLYHTREKTLVYDRITPDIIFDMNRESTQPLTVYVEDDLAEAIVSQLSDGLRISRYVNIRNIGSAQNAFTLAAGMMIEGNSLEHRLIVLDGDVYRTDEDKKRQLRRLLSGTETNHDDKIDAALSLITQFSLPEGNCPEKFIYDLLLDVDGADEATDCAKQVTGVVDSHDWLNQIVERMNQDRKIVLLKIIEQAAESDKWSTYVERVRRWLIEQAKALNLYSP